MTSGCCSRRAPLVALTVLLTFALGTPSAGQELTRAIHLTEENDYFDFLLPISRRPDNNYTQGVRVGYDLAAVPSFVRHLVCRDRHACTATLEVGQQMYTPTKDGDHPIPGQRPYAGWLYARGSTATATTRMRRSIGITLGVTGSASLAAQTQTAFHRLIGKFHPLLGWSQQLPTEADFAIDAEQAWYLAPPGRAARYVDIVPTVRATMGTLRTALGVGGRARLGPALLHPWLVDARARWWDTYLFLGGQLSAIGHDLFLDGTTFRRSVHVDREPLVADWEYGIGVRIWRIAVEYGVVTQGREYRAGPRAHAYGGFTIAWRMTP